MPKMKRSDHAAAKKHRIEGRKNDKRNLGGSSSSRNVDANLEYNRGIDKVPPEKSKERIGDDIKCSFCPKKFKHIGKYNLHYTGKHLKQHGPLPNLENSNTVKDTIENEHFENNSSNNRKRRRCVNLNIERDMSYYKPNFEYEKNNEDRDYEPTRAKIYKTSNTTNSKLNKESDSSDISKLNDENNSDYESTRDNVDEKSYTTDSKLNKENDSSDIYESSDENDSDYEPTRDNMYEESNTTDSKLYNESDCSDISESSGENDSDFEPTRANIYETSNTTDLNLNKENDSSDTYESSDENDSDYEPTRDNMYKESNTTDSKLNNESDCSDISESSGEKYSDFEPTRANIYETSNTTDSKLNKDSDSSDICESCDENDSDDDRRSISGDNDLSTRAKICKTSNTTDSKLNKESASLDISESSDYDLSTQAKNKNANTAEPKLNKKRKPSKTGQDSDNSCFDSDNEFHHIFNKYVKKINNCLSKMQKKFKSTTRIAYKCKTCSLHFLEKSEWRKHLLTGIHTVNSSKCDRCMLIFSSKSMKKHLKMHEKNGKIEEKLKFHIITEMNYSLSENIIEISNDRSESDDKKKMSDAISTPGCSKTGGENSTTEKSYKNHEDTIKNISNDQVHVKRKYKEKLLNDEQHFLNRKAVELHRRKKCTNHKDLPKVGIITPRRNSNKTVQSRNQILNHNRSDNLYNKEMTMYKCEGCNLHFLNRTPWVSHLLTCKNKLNNATVKECPYCKLYFTKNKTWNYHIKIHQKYPSITKTDFRIQSGIPRDFNTVTVHQSDIVTTIAKNCASNTTANEHANIDFSLNQSNCKTTTNADESCKVTLAKTSVTGPDGWHVVKNDSKYDVDDTIDVVSKESISAMVADDCGNMNQGTETVHKLSDMEGNSIEAANADTVLKLCVNNVRATVDKTIDESTEINKDHNASSLDHIVPSTFDNSNNTLDSASAGQYVVNTVAAAIENIAIANRSEDIYAHTKNNENNHNETETIHILCNNECKFIANEKESTKNNENHILSSRDNIVPINFDNSNNNLLSESTGHVVNTAETATENIAIAGHSDNSYAHNENKKYYYSETELINILSDNVGNLIESTQKNNHYKTALTHILSDNESKLIESTNKSAVVNLNELRIDNVSFTVDTATNNVTNATESTKNNEDHISTSRDNITPSTFDNLNSNLNSESKSPVVNTADTSTENIAIASHNEDGYAHNTNIKYYYSETELINILSDNVSNLPSSFDNSNKKLLSGNTGHVVNTVDAATENVHNENQVINQYETFIKNEQIEESTADKAIKKEMIDERIETNNCNYNLSIKTEYTRDIKKEVLLEKTEINDFAHNGTQMKNRDCKKDIKAENIEPHNNKGHINAISAEVIKIENVAAEDGQEIKNEKSENNNINSEIVNDGQSMQIEIKTETENIAPKVENNLKKDNYKEEIKIEYDEPANQLESNSSSLDYIKIVNYYSIRPKLEEPSSSSCVEDVTDAIDSPEMIHGKEIICDNTKYFSDEFENPQSTYEELNINNDMSSSHHERNKIQQHGDSDMIHQCDENTMTLIEDERSMNGTHFEETFLKSECNSEIINKKSYRVSNDNEKRSHFSKLNTQNRDLDERQDDTNREAHEGIDNFKAKETISNNKTTTHASVLSTDTFSTKQERQESSSGSFYFGGIYINRNGNEVTVKDEENLTVASHIKKEVEDVEARNRQPLQTDQQQQLIEEVIISDSDDDEVVMIPNTVASVVISDDEDYFI